MLTCSPLVLSPLSPAACSCHPVGSVVSGGSTLCNPSSGECTCKPGVGGPHCESCMLGYWGLHEYGCRPCDCTGDCDPYTGDCISGWVPRCNIIFMCLYLDNVMYGVEVECILDDWHWVEPCRWLVLLLRHSSDVEVFYTATGHMGHSSNNSETALFRLEELFSALHHSGESQVISHLIHCTLINPHKEKAAAVILKSIHHDEVIYMNLTV